MNRRDAITSISMAGGASLLPSGEPVAGALAPAAAAAFTQAVRGTAPVKIRDVKTILTAPNRIRLVVVKIETTEPGLVGWGCATFTQRALVGADGARAIPEAVSDGQERRRDRGHLAIELRQLLLAQRPGPVQRHERRRHRALGHQGQARRYAALSTAGRQSAAWRRLLLPRQRRDAGRSRGERAQRHGCGLPTRARADEHARLLRLWRAHRSSGRDCRRRRGRRADESARDLGAGPVLPHAAQTIRAPAHRSSARTSNCCTTSTSG